jgi:hypothetical protein
MIVFGVSNYTIRQWTTAHLKLPVDPAYRDTILYRQQYFHLMYIPLFGIKKYWILKRKTIGKRLIDFYEVPDDWKKLAQESIARRPVQWYYKLGPYSFFFAAILAGFIYLSIPVVNSAIRSVWPANNEIISAEQLLEAENRVELSVKEKIKNPSTADFYYCNFAGPFLSDVKLYFKVQRITESQLFLVSIRNKLKTGFNEKAVSDSLELRHFAEKPPYKLGFWVPRNKLEKAAGADSARKFQAWKEDSDNGAFLITEIVRIPQLSDTLLPAKK